MMVEKQIDCALQKLVRFEKMLEQRIFELVDELSRIANVAVPQAIGRSAMRRCFTIPCVKWMRCRR